jgi:molybdate transport system ATP-binding protein
MSLLLENISLKLAAFTLRVEAKLSAPITGLSGPSGAGKTTLLEIIAGIRQADTATISLHDRILTDTKKSLHIPPARRRVAYVPQDLALFPHLDAMANLHYGYRHNQPQSILPERVVDVLELKPLLGRSIHQLSGGEQQRIALGRALLAHPQLLLLDEPLSNLDDRLRERILPYIKAIHSEFQVPMIYVTHSQMELKFLCDEILEIDAGKWVVRDQCA